MARIRQARKEKNATSIGYHGNVVDLWYCLFTEATHPYLSLFLIYLAPKTCRTKGHVCGRAFVSSTFEQDLTKISRCNYFKFINSYTYIIVTPHSSRFYHSVMMPVAKGLRLHCNPSRITSRVGHYKVFK